MEGEQFSVSQPFKFYFKKKKKKCMIFWAAMHHDSLLLGVFMHIIPQIMFKPFLMYLKSLNSILRKRSRFFRTTRNCFVGHLLWVSWSYCDLRETSAGTAQGVVRSVFAESK